jgi:hypothetical protein
MPTELIPPNLRRVGSRFLVNATFASGNKEAEQMTADEIRNTRRMSVHEITDE